MPVQPSGAQRASFHRSTRLTVFALIAGLVAGLGAMANPTPVAAATIKVVVVVGPAGSNTSNYIYNGKRYANVAREYGAKVIEIYSPNATWSRVRDALQGANLLIYLGHGNGWPSPYAPFRSSSKDGLGLNSSAGNGHYNVKYYGEYYIDRYIQMDKNAVVILNRLCYASGNSEWGRADPTQYIAVARVDNYAAGFLRAGAKAVFAHAIESATWTIRSLFRSDRTMDSIFMSHPDASGARDLTFNSYRTSGMKGHMDPPKASKYWRSVTGVLGMSAKEWRAGAT